MKFVRSNLFKVALLAFILSLLTALPTFAAATTGTINSVTRANCTLIINVTVNPGGTYYVNIWDDGSIVDSISFTASGGVPTDVQYNIANAADTGAPGIGIYLGTTPTNGGGSDTLARLDPFFYPFPCTETCVLLPANAVVGNLPYPTRAYWAPGKITPEVTLNAGTYWVVGKGNDDAGKPYYEIVLSCQYLYVPAASMGPSFQFPWQGQALPTNGPIS